MLANWITIARFPLLALALGLLALGSSPVRVGAAALLCAGLMLDTVDGVVARTRGETSLVGSVLDIAADRTYELVLWVYFAGAGIVPIAFPIIVAARTALTDALRSIGVSQGAAPFAQHATRLGRCLVGSAWMRTGYSVSKVVAFSGMALMVALPAEAAPVGGGILVVASVALGFCIVRGIPVLAHAARPACS